MQRSHLVHACALVAVAVPVPPALAQPLASPTPTESAREIGPSAAPESTQRTVLLDGAHRAAELFAEGSDLFKQWRFVQAEEKYRAALVYWEHPAIYLYLSRALEKQGRLVEAHAALQQSLGHELTPLSPEDSRLAEELRKDLESRLAQIDVHCDQTGAQVMLDGQLWFVAPGRRRKMVSAGQHVIVARKAGYFPVTEVVPLTSGKRIDVEIHMSVDEIRTERHWQPWAPWVITGGGVATTLLGGLLLQQAASDYADFRATLAACQGGATCDQVSTRMQQRGEWKEYVGTGVLIAGSAAMAVGLLGALINVPRSYRSEPTDRVRYELMPLLSNDTAGLSAVIEF